MTEEELKKLALEYQKGLEEVEEVKREFNEKFENLSEEEFIEEFSKQLDEVSKDVSDIKKEKLSKK